MLYPKPLPDLSAVSSVLSRENTLQGRAALWREDVKGENNNCRVNGSGNQCDSHSFNPTHLVNAVGGPGHKSRGGQRAKSSGQENGEQIVQLLWGHVFKFASEFAHCCSYREVCVDILIITRQERPQDGKYVLDFPPVSGWSWHQPLHRVMNLSTTSFCTMQFP